MQLKLLWTLAFAVVSTQAHGADAGSTDESDSFTMPMVKRKASITSKLGLLDHPKYNTVIDVQLPGMDSPVPVQIDTGSNLFAVIGPGVEANGEDCMSKLKCTPMISKETGLPLNTTVQYGGNDGWSADICAPSTLNFAGTQIQVPYGSITDNMGGFFQTCNGYQGIMGASFPIMIKADVKTKEAQNALSAASPVMEIAKQKGLTQEMGLAVCNNGNQRNGGQVVFGKPNKKYFTGKLAYVPVEKQPNSEQYLMFRFYTEGMQIAGSDTIIPGGQVISDSGRTMTSLDSKQWAAFQVGLQSNVKEFIEGNQGGCWTMKDIVSVVPSLSYILPGNETITIPGVRFISDKLQPFINNKMCLIAVAETPDATEAAIMLFNKRVVEVSATNSATEDVTWFGQTVHHELYISHDYENHRIGFAKQKGCRGYKRGNNRQLKKVIADMGF